MGLDEKITFQLIQVSSEEAYTQLLIVFTPQFSHYLFGYDDRPSGTRQSTAAAAQFQALDLSRARGISYYDLNGYTDPSDLSHPYAGVSQFKSQWGGAEVRWAAPKFVIS
jgi:lipid II:glycine glycyltransferase (peptidoglycan interpeptide bridge formation enzyme)